ncbi:rho GTPase-activating protein 19-like isoform X5 [Branchiostoma lanceolatum]|uniref:rho GTPase-activating protein 19-like isoform X5 n=1 Tax=Branchiostoma lanceolatum TaxID=7740 RepID=UPI0034537A43
MDGPSVQTISQAITNPDYWVDKLRFEDPETFKELCGGMLTRFLDLPGPELSRVLGTSPVKDKRRFLAKKKGGVFGAPLTEEGLAQIHQLIDFLGNHTHVEGIFRIPGNSHRQQRLKDSLNSGVDIDLDLGEFTPHDVASVLKIFLGELPEPLLTTRHYPAYLQVPDMMLFDKSVKTDKPNKERQIETYQLLFWLLPNVNRKLLQAVLSLLYKTAQAQKDHKNRMSAHNLGVMFAPHVLWPRSLTIADLKDNVNKLNGAVAFIIKHSQRVFLAPVQLRAQCRLHYAAKEKSAAQQKTASSGNTASPSDEVAQTRAKKRPHEDAESKTQTDLALAQLYAHVQAMPDSHKKRKYVKQFNDHSNCTPGSPNHKVLPRTRGKHVRSKSWGAAITKLFGSNKPQTQTRSGAHSDPRRSSQTPTSDRIGARISSHTEVNTPGAICRNTKKTQDTPAKKRMIPTAFSQAQQLAEKENVTLHDVETSPIAL